MGIKLTQRLIFLDDVFKRTSVPQVFRGIETAIHFLHFLENPRHSLVNITTVPVAILSLTMFAERIGCRPITFGVTACSLRLEVTLSPVSSVQEVSSSERTWASTALLIASLNSLFAFFDSSSPRIVRADKNVRGSSRMAIKILSSGTSKRCCIAHSSRFKAHFATSPRACRSFSKLRATFASVVPFCCFVLTLMIRKGPWGSFLNREMIAHSSLVVTSWIERPSFLHNFAAAHR